MTLTPMPQAPHLSAWINCFRAGLNAILAWTSFCLMVLTYSVHWEENHDKEPGSHAHWTWYPWGTRVLWTNVSARQPWCGRATQLASHAAAGVVPAVAAAAGALACTARLPARPGAHAAGRAPTPMPAPLHPPCPS